ncbi:MAG: polymer-forming cytoskeletal protein [Acidobacteriota bacterium]
MSVAPTREFTVASPRTATTRNEEIVNIGQSICIRGELTGNEDLTIEGKIEGKIDLEDHHLTIGPKGRIQAEIGAKTVLVKGEVNGNIHATDKVELAETGRVRGDIVAPRIAIADGARFKGSVDMTGTQADSAKGAVREKTKVTVAKSAPLITDAPVVGTSRPVARS